eukprot:4983116-Pyramimonas_sp.AAC.1
MSCSHLPATRPPSKNNSLSSRQSELSGPRTRCMQEVRTSVSDRSVAAGLAPSPDFERDHVFDFQRVAGFIIKY